MGSKKDTPKNSLPGKVYTSGSSEDFSVTSSAGIVGGQAEGGIAEQDFLDVPLVLVDRIVLSTVQVRNKVQVKVYEVYVKNGRLGEIPRDFRHLIASKGFRNGFVLDTKAVIVRLFAP
jgi:hypothetical protein